MIIEIVNRKIRQRKSQSNISSKFLQFIIRYDSSIIRIIAKIICLTRPYKKAVRKNFAIFTGKHLC